MLPPIPLDPSLRPYATDIQWQYYEAYCRLKSLRGVAKELNRSYGSVSGSIDNMMRVVELAKSKPSATLRGPDGAVKLQWTRENATLAQQEETLRRIVSAMSREIKPTKRIKQPPSANKDFLAVYPVGDHHHGMLAWAQETGDSDYDVKVSERRLARASQILIDTCPPSEHALVAFLGDYFHYDSYKPLTPAHGNLLDADSRFPKMVDSGIALMLRVIDAAARKHKFVTVIVEKGNHDEAIAAATAIFLKHLYKSNDRITIDTSPQFYHYYEFGKVLLATHHGHKAKLERLPAIMAADKSGAWGRTSYRMWLTGHVHHESRKEFPGCFVETFGVLAPQDAYASAGGWRSISQMHALLFHRAGRLSSRYVVTPDMFE